MAGWLDGWILDEITKWMVSILRYLKGFQMNCQVTCYSLTWIDGCMEGQTFEQKTGESFLLCAVSADLQWGMMAISDGATNSRPTEAHRTTV